jgi:hypothetical protein
MESVGQSLQTHLFIGMKTAFTAWPNGRKIAIAITVMFEV